MTTTSALSPLSPLAAKPTSNAVALDQGQSDDKKVAKTKAAMKASQDFESVFLSQMFQHMWQGVGADKTFGGGQGEEMFKSMMTDEYAKQVTRHGGVGIAAAVQKEMLKHQEVQG